MFSCLVQISRHYALVVKVWIGYSESNTLPVVIFGSLATKPLKSLGVLGKGALFPSGMKDFFWVLFRA